MAGSPRTRNESGGVSDSGDIETPIRSTPHTRPLINYGRDPFSNTAENLPKSQKENCSTNETSGDIFSSSGMDELPDPSKTNSLIPNRNNQQPKDSEPLGNYQITKNKFY